MGDPPFAVFEGWGAYASKIESPVSLPGLGLPVGTPSIKNDYSGA